jgi:MFS family permease
MMKDIASILCFFALLTGNNNVSAFQQRRQGYRYHALTTPLQSQRIPGDFGKNARRSMVPFRRVNSRLASGSYGLSKSSGETPKTRIKLSSVPVELPRSRGFLRRLTSRKSVSASDAGVGVLTPPPHALSPIEKTTQKQTAEEATAVKAVPRISKLDVALFVTYFCNMFVINLSVVTIPALSALSFSTAATSAAFESGVASMAPLGGAFGKVVNGFVVQRLGPRRSSMLYLMAVSALSCTMSFNKSIGAIGMFLVAYEFLSSIQWTALCGVLDENFQDPSAIARGLAIMSMSSYTGALAAKTVGAALLKVSGCWRTVTQIGAVVALIGASAMFSTRFLGAAKGAKTDVVVVKEENTTSETTTNPLSVLKSILTSRVFWMVGIGHSLGYIVRSSDRLLVPFLYEATGFPRKSHTCTAALFQYLSYCTRANFSRILFIFSYTGHICASLTSSITLGMVLGLGQGTHFTAMKSISDKMKMLKRNYIQAIGSFLGLGVCALNVMNGWIKAPYLMATAISLLSGLAASSISFQFSQFPNLVATNMFPENKAVALSLVDAAGFFVTSQVLTANTKVLSTLGWSASWTFLSLCLGIGTTLLMKQIHPVLAIERKKLRAMGKLE